MFTGIIEELGAVREVVTDSGGARITIAAPKTAADLELGGSVAVNGCCLTAVSVEPDGFSADAVQETLARTALGELQPGETVNLERPLRVNGRLDGHLVQGHVDGTGTISFRRSLPDGSYELVVAAPSSLTRFLVEKGSITVDGVSLTVVSVDEQQFSVALIPHTANVTTLGQKPEGGRVNLEVDVVAKYVERLLRPHVPR